MQVAEHEEGSKLLIRGSIKIIQGCYERANRLFGGVLTMPHIKFDYKAYYGVSYLYSTRIYTQLGSPSVFLQADPVQQPAAPAPSWP